MMYPKTRPNFTHEHNIYLDIVKTHAFIKIAGTCKIPEFFNHQVGPFEEYPIRIKHR